MVSRAPVHRNDLVVSRADSTPVRVEDIVRMTGEVLEGGEQFNINNKGKGPNGKVLHSGISPADVRKQSRDAGGSSLSVLAANPLSKVGISSDICTVSIPALVHCKYGCGCCIS